MFQGTAPDGTRKIIAKLIPIIGDRVVIPCSGNFTLESVLRKNGYQGEIISGDVSIYTTFFGFAMTGMCKRLEIKDQDYEWLEPYLQDPVTKFATIALVLDLVQFAKQDNDFRVAKWNMMLSNWDSLFEAMVAKVKGFKESVRIDGFLCQDLMKTIDNPGEKDTLLFFPPTYKSGYERLYKAINEIFSWDAPEYDVFEQDQKFFDKIKQAHRYIIFSEIDIREYFDDEYFAKVRKNRSITLWGFTNLDTGRYFVKRKYSVTPFVYEPIGNNELSSDFHVTLKKIDSSRFNYLREIYLGKNIDLASAIQLCVLVYVDNYLIGGIGVADGKYAQGCAYIMCDFALPSKYKRLSKLVVTVLKTQEFKRLIEREFVKRFTNVYTTAFTTKPVSMKYRGLMKLLKRGKDFLNYGCDAGEITLEEGVEAWKQKYQSETR